MKTALLIIDPQKDFIDDPKFQGSLAVPGAFEDMQRLSTYIYNNKLDSIYVTLDTHDKMHIANPIWWINSQGKHPEPFTLISYTDVLSKKWQCTLPEKQEHSLNYVQELEKKGKFVLCIWPYHCINGTEGHQVTDIIKNSLIDWEIKENKKVEYIYKGQNPNTEMYSGIKAEVIIPDDDKTKVNTCLINKLIQFDTILIAGEAKSHCVSSTVSDLIVNFRENSNKIIILEDCMSNVPGFETNGDKFIQFATENNCLIKRTKENLKNKKIF